MMTMCKPILVLLMLIAYMSISAQNSFSETGSERIVTGSSNLSKISLGLKISPAISWIDVVNTDVQADGASLKYGVGGVLNYQFLRNLSLVSGINFNTYGGYVYDNKSLSDTVFRKSYRINYGEIEIPVALKIKTTVLKKTSYFLQGGFSAGFIVNSSEERTPFADNAETDFTDISALTNPVRLTCLLGGGVEYLIGRKTALFGLLSYKKTLTNVANSGAYSPSRYSTSIQLYPGSMELSVGIMF